MNIDVPSLLIGIVVPVILYGMYYLGVSAGKKNKPKK